MNNTEEQINMVATELAYRLGRFQISHDISYDIIYSALTAIVNWQEIQKQTIKE